MVKKDHGVTWPHIQPKSSQLLDVDDVGNLPGSTGQERGQTLHPASFESPCRWIATGGAKIAPPTHHTMPDA